MGNYFSLEVRMRKKKICILSAHVPFVMGGAELMIQSLRKNLVKRGYDTEIITIPFKWYPENSLYDSMLTWRMIDLEEANGEKIDLVIGTKFPSYGVQHSNKVIWTIQQFRQAYDLYNTEHGLHKVENGANIRKRIQKYDEICFSEAKKVFTISKNVSKRLETYNHINSVPLYQPPSLEGRYYADESEDYILSVGRLDKLKRVDLLLKALPFCDKKIRLKIAGKGAELEALQKLARLLKIEDRVDFLGFVDDDMLLELYAKAIAVYFAPVDEDYGFITLEAFFSHKPVVTCKDAGGVLEFVEDEKNGFVCSASPEEIGERFNDIFYHKSKAKEMGEMGFHVVKDIGWDSIVDNLTSTIR